MEPESPAWQADSLPLSHLGTLNPVGPEQSAEEEDCPNQCNVRTLSRFSRVQLFVTLWAVARQAPLSVGFSRQEHWSGLPCPPPGDLPHPEVEPSSHVS